MEREEFKGEAVFQMVSKRSSLNGGMLRVRVRWYESDIQKEGAWNRNEGKMRERDASEVRRPGKGSTCKYVRCTVHEGCEDV